MQPYNAKHYDIEIAQKLCKMYGKECEVIKEPYITEDLSDSLDLPYNDDHIIYPYFEGYTVLNGNISEIGRNYFGSFNKVTAGMLAYFNGYSQSGFVIGEYQKWLYEIATAFQQEERQEEKSFAMTKRGASYHILDLFYWEQRMGIWLAKSKTIMNTLGIDCFTPYNSHGLLSLLLSTDRKLRNKYDNKLYEAILLELSPKALKLPLNPSFRQFRLKLLTKLGLLNFYSYIRYKLKR
jgi:hypothetical protein